MAGFREDAERVESAWFDAIRTGDAQALTPLYEADASSLAPDQRPRFGRDDVLAYWQEEIDRGLRDGSFETISADEHGELCYEVGRYVFVMAPPGEGESWQERGSHLTVYRKRGDDSVRVIAECLAPLGQVAGRVRE